MHKLEPILIYKMNKIEAKAFRLALIWEELTQREFPNYKHTKLRKKGDPRKSVLFRHCYKLVNMTKGLIPDNEYRLYILAQLRTMAKIREGDVHAMIEPAILTSKNAWKRWKIWKWQFDKEQKLKNKNAEEISRDIFKLECDLKNTKKFLATHTEMTVSHFKKLIADRTFHVWLVTDKISPYFIVLSPVMKEALEGRNPNEVFEMDFGVCHIDNEARQIFDKVFS